MSVCPVQRLWQLDFNYRILCLSAITALIGRKETHYFCKVMSAKQHPGVWIIKVILFLKAEVFYHKFWFMLFIILFLFVMMFHIHINNWWSLSKFNYRAAMKMWVIQVSKLVIETLCTVHNNIKHVLQCESTKQLMYRLLRSSVENEKLINDYSDISVNLLISSVTEG